MAKSKRSSLPSTGDDEDIKSMLASLKNRLDTVVLSTAELNKKFDLFSLKIEENAAAAAAAAAIATEALEKASVLQSTVASLEAGFNSLEVGNAELRKVVADLNKVSSLPSC